MPRKQILPALYLLVIGKVQVIMLTMEWYIMNKKVIAIGYMDNGTGQHQSNTVINPCGLSPAITTLQGGTQQIKVLVKYNERRKNP